jgi:hypothetical protein
VRQTPFRETELATVTPFAHVRPTSRPCAAEDGPLYQRRGPVPTGAPLARRVST